MLALFDPYREPGRGRSPQGPHRSLDIGLLASLLVLAGWTTLRVVSCALHGRLDGEGAMASVLLVGVLHAIARSRPS
jgi:purine-cytosine permease-like protein